MANCFICSGPHLHDHHIRPVAYGGPKDGPTVPLCADHHTMIHNAALAITANKYFDLSHLSGVSLIRAQMLIRHIIKTKQERDNVAPELLPSKITLEIPRSTLTRIHQRKFDLNIASVQAYLLWLVTNDLNKFR